MTDTVGEGVSNPAVRAALDEFVASAGARGSLDVLRWCLQGFLLLDVTGSDLRMNADGTQLEAGSSVQIATMAGPDGESALAAFTSAAEIEKIHHTDGAAETHVQSLVQPAAAVLELAAEQDHKWICLDPAGPSCALSREDIDFALRVPRNDAVRQALDVVNVDPDQRPVLLDALRAEGTFVLAVDAHDLPEGPLAEDTPARVRTTTMPDDRPALLVFTSGPEAAARAEGDSFMVWSTAEVHEALRDGDFAGLVINPAGPWAAVTVDELFSSEGAR
jgi:SseB protein N-terminal domain